MNHNFIRAHLKCTWLINLDRHNRKLPLLGMEVQILTLTLYDDDHDRLNKEPTRNVCPRQTRDLVRAAGWFVTAIISIREFRSASTSEVENFYQIIFSGKQFQTKTCFYTACSSSSSTTQHRTKMDRDRTVRRLPNGVKKVTVLAVICQLLASVYCWPDVAIKTPQSDILLITMGGTRSHKIPFIALAKGLIAK